MRSTRSVDNQAQWLSWLERRPVTAEVVGSSPSWVVCKNSLDCATRFERSEKREIEHLVTSVRAARRTHAVKCVRREASTIGIIAQLGEHLPYKQGVTGSSPVGPIYFEKTNCSLFISWLEERETRAN